MSCVEAVTGLIARHRLNCRFACATPFKELKRNGASHPVSCVEADTGLLAQHRLNCRAACATPFKGIEAVLGASHPVCCVEAVTGLLAQHRLNCRFACATPFKGLKRHWRKPSGELCRGCHRAACAAPLELQVRLRDTV